MTGGVRVSIFLYLMLSKNLLLGLSHHWQHIDIWYNSPSGSRLAASKYVGIIGAS